MESEDLFQEELSEEIISALEEEYVEPPEDILPEEETEETIAESVEEDTETEQPDKG